MDSIHIMLGQLYRSNKLANLGRINFVFFIMFCLCKKNNIGHASFPFYFICSEKSREAKSI